IRSGRSPNLRLPFVGELQGALADGGAEGLVCRDGVEPFGLGLALVSQEVNQTQSLTLCSELRRPRPSIPDSQFPIFADRRQTQPVGTERDTADVFKIPFRFGLGLINLNTLSLNAVLTPMIVLGLFSGRWLIHRIPQRLFDSLVLAFSAIAALRLIGAI